VYPDPKHWLKIIEKTEIFRENHPGTKIFRENFLENENFRKNENFREKFANAKIFAKSERIFAYFCFSRK
jgi:hypothetical protein